ncbi:MAG: hypothetical protein IT376_03015 [Polyangiaceae bacterium]|nr:hypothetical protein [Polyangiaceae bacterium]
MGSTSGKRWVAGGFRMAGVIGAGCMAAACAGHSEPGTPGEAVEPASAAVEGAGSPPVGPVDPVAHGVTAAEIAWADLPTNGASTKTLAFELARAQKGKVEVRPVVVAAGLDGRVAREPLELVEVTSGSPRRLAVEVGSLPIQAQRGLVQVAIELELPGGVVVSTAPLYLEHAPGYAEAKVFDAAGGLGRGGADAAGRLRGPTGWVEWADPASPAGAAGRRGVPFAVGASRAEAVSPEAEADRLSGGEGAAAPAPAGPTAVTVKLCTRWRVQYADTGQGEDVWTSAGWQSVQAPFALASVFTQGGGTLKWLGNLDASGCTPALTLPAGTYELRQSTGSTTLSGRAFNVYQVTGGTPALTVVTTSFYWANTTTSTIQMYPAYNNQAVQAAPIVGRLLLVNAFTDLGVNAGTYTLRMNQECPSVPGNGCVSGGVVYVPAAQASWKNIIAHEIGHQIQGAAMGAPYYDYSQDATEAYCRCDHVTSANQLHCLQSREQTGAAQIEGWAHFVAARLFNNKSESNCTYVYYKEFLESGDEFPAILPPPLGRSCWNPIRWMESYCVANNRGVEWDWLNFYWKVNSTGGTATISVSQLYDIYRRACGTYPASCNSSNTVNWTQALAGAYVHFGSNQYNASYLHFLNRGMDHGVDN